MSNETPSVQTPLVATQLPSLRGLKQTFFGAAAVGSLITIVPAVFSAIKGDDLYASLGTAAFALVALTAGTAKFVVDNHNRSSCASNIIFIAAQGFATVTSEMFSISNLMQNPNPLTVMAAVGTGVMNGSVTATAALSCVR